MTLRTVERPAASMTPPDPSSAGQAALRVLLVGLSRQVGVAMEHIVQAVHPTAVVVKHDRESTVSMSILQALAKSSDLCIIDVPGLGWTTWTEPLAADLELVVGWRRAVLLLPPGDGGGWLQALESRRSAQQCIRLQHPASLASMRMALDRLRKLPPLPDPPRPAPVTERAVTAAFTPAEDPELPVETTSGFIELPLELPPPPHIEPAVLDPVPRAAAPDGPATPPDETDAPVSGFVDLPIEPLASAASPAGAQTDPEPPVSGFVDLPLHAAEPAEATSAPPSPSPADDETDDDVPRHLPIAGSARAALPPAPTPAPRPQRAWPVTPFVLQASAYQAVVDACPAVPASPLLDRLLRMAIQGGPQEFRVGRHAAVVLHPAENWVSSNMSVALRKRLTAHKLMLQIADVVTLAPDHAIEAARALYGRREDGRRPLDGHFWSLVWRTFEEAPPAIDGALKLHLRRFPDVTRLPPMPDACLQMAIVCRGRSHSVDELRRMFPSQDPGLIGLFALCAVLSGMADVVTPAPADSPPPPQDDPAPAPTPRKPLLKGGFIRALLAKLF